LTGRAAYDDSLEQPSRISPSWHYLALGAALACITTIVVLVPNVPVAVYEPRLSMTIGCVSSAISLALLQSCLLRFKVLRQPIDLHTGLAFGVLAVSNLYVALAPVAGVAGPRLENAVYFLVLAHATAAILFLSGLAGGRKHRHGSTTAQWRWMGLTTAATCSVFGIAILCSQGAALPVALDESARQVIAAGTPIDDIMRGQQPALLVANVAISAALLLSAIGYMIESKRVPDAHIAALAAALIFMFFAQVHAIVFPYLPSGYLAAGDIFGLVACALLLSSMLWRTVQDVARAAIRDERVRISRELHDGLAQQLVALGLRLSRVGETTEQRARDLEIARRILASASMEARQSIAALRCERTPWDEVKQALEAFLAEFSSTRDLDAQLCVGPSDVRIDSRLRADILRICQEAFSNAARHSHAKHLAAVLEAHATAVLLIVRDDGEGFDPRSVRLGVGLRSMMERAEGRGGCVDINSAPGGGTTVTAWLPYASQQRGV
jgi:signal transduction histidine kinase